MLSARPVLRTAARSAIAVSRTLRVVCIIELLDTWLAKVSITSLLKS